MAIRNKDQIIKDAQDFLKSKRPDIATFTGSVTKDVVIDSPAEEFEKVNEELERTQKLQSIVFAKDQTQEELDAFGENYGMRRNQGKKSGGSVTFQIRNFSTSSASISIPIGTVIATVGTGNIPQVSFVTTEALIFDPTQAPSYFNPTSGLYELSASVTSELVGTIGNLSAGTITQTISAINGISSIVNTVATTGGEDIEDNTDFAGRIQQKLIGNNIGTPNGILNLMSENQNVIDSVIVKAGDPEMLRDENGGEVDVYIVGENISSAIDIILYQVVVSQEFILKHQPASSVTSITGIADLGGGPVPYTFIQGIDFNFVLDMTTLLAGSTQMENKVVFDIGGIDPEDGTNITINYTYNLLIEELQAELDADDNHIVTADLLVKEGVRAVIDITADVKLFPGNASAVAITDIQNQLSTDINSLGLGDSIDRSDVVASIEAVSSVDQVDLSTLGLAKDGVPLPSADQRLLIDKTEYPRIGIININVI